MDKLATTTTGDGEVRYVSILPPQPGEVCPTCSRKVPKSRAAYMREWRKRRGIRTNS